MSDRVTFDVRFKGSPKKLTMRHAGFVVVRHTRTGDDIQSFHTSGEDAMWKAERAEDAAHVYGHGSTSVLRAHLVISGKPLRPKGGR